MSQIYALGIGISPDGSSEQRYLMEDCGEAFPSFATVIAREAGLNAPELDIDLAGVVLSRLCVEFLDTIPVEGDISVTSRVEALADHGLKGAEIWTVTDVGSPRPIARVWQGLRARKDGGRGSFGRVPAQLPAMAESGQENPIAVPLNLAHLFRQSGDRNLLHIDATVARAAGFERPILHGQAVFGLMARQVAKRVSDFAMLDVRFTAPVCPGDDLIWSCDVTSEDGRFSCSERRGVRVAEGQWHGRSSSAALRRSFAND